MSEADFVWGGLLLLGAGYEAYTLATKRKGDTASETTRRWFHVRTTPGRVMFLVALYGGATWFAGHVLDFWP